MRITLNNRPNPDSLLSLVTKDKSINTKGRLKIFFGACAGVGKTYAMLSQAKRKFYEGTDVLVGIVETHGRTETAEMLKGIPVIPAKNITYKGIVLKEFDLEKAISLKPTLILVDELAHTNAANSRHPKRWQDVEELLNAGIDVYTTLNVQHLESVNDVITKITGITIQETIPDNIFDKADEVLIVDISAEELIKRLQDGKIYSTDGANKHAFNNFFKKSNILALREISLRRMAERVDAEGDVLTLATGKKESQLGEKILVCVGHDRLSKQVIRHAKRQALRTKSPWHVLYVETDRHERLTEKAKIAVEQNLRLAEQMGAQIVRITGNNAYEEVLNYAKEYGFTRIMVGRRTRLLFYSIFNSLSSNLINNGDGFEISVITEKVPKESKKIYKSFFSYYFNKPTEYIFAILFLCVATLLGLPFREIVNFGSLSIIYLTTIVIIAAKLGTGPSIIASILSLLLFNFFFIEPYYTFEVYEQSYYFNFLVMLIASLIVGSLASKLSLQAKQARIREAETSIFYGLTRELSSVKGTENIINVATKHINQAFKMSSVIFLPQSDGKLKSSLKGLIIGYLKEESVANWVFKNGEIAGRNTDTLPSARGIYAALSVENKILGVLGLIPENNHDFTGQETIRLQAFASIIASSVERTLKN